MKNLEKKLFSNIGSKLKGLAVVISIIGVLAVVVGIIIALIGAVDNADELVTVGLIVAGSGIMSWVSTWPLYTFGQITDDIHNGTFKGTSKIERLPEL